MPGKTISRTHGDHRRRSRGGGSWGSNRTHGGPRLALDDLARLAGDYTFLDAKLTPAHVKILHAHVKTHLQRFACGYHSDTPVVLIAASFGMAETTIRRHLATTPSAAWCTFETHLAGEILTSMDRRKVPSLSAWPHNQDLEWIALRVADAAAPTGGWPAALLEPWARFKIEYRAWAPDRT